MIGLMVGSHMFLCRYTPPNKAVTWLVVVGIVVVTGSA